MTTDEHRKVGGYVMERAVADEIGAALKQLEAAIGQLDLAVRKVSEAAERKPMLHCIATLIHEIHMNITLPVVQHHPDLHPDNPGSTRY